MIKRLENIIFYFEGTCEICLGNRGIERYKNEINELMVHQDDYTEEIKLRLYFAHAIIEYKLDHFENAVKSWKQALKYAQSQKDNIYIGKISSYLGIYYYFKKNKELERHYSETAEDVFKEEECFGELACHYINILWFKRYERDQRQVQEYMDNALYYIQLSDSKKNARVYLHIGYIYKTIFNDYIKSIGYLIKSNELSRKHGFIEMETMTFHVLADVYCKINRYSEAIEIYSEIIENDKFSGITANLKAAILCSLIACYLKVKDVQRVESYLFQLNDLIYKVQKNIREHYYAVLLGLKAEYYCIKGDKLNDALELIHQSEEIYRKHKNSVILEEFDYFIASRTGDIYLGLGEYEKAMNSYKELEIISRQYGKWQQKDGKEKLASIYEIMGDYEKALLYYRNANEIFNKIKINNMEQQYETIYKEFIKAIKEEEINQLEEINIVLERDSYQDVLTNVYNRNYLYHYMEEKKQNLKKGSHQSVMIIDIDFFKSYNDYYGHDKGDEVLKRIADLFKEIYRETHCIIRYGGDEFIIFLEETSKREAISLAKTILENVNRENIAHALSEISDRITVSIGIASYIQKEEYNLEEIIQYADRALYVSKMNGKNQYIHEEDIFVKQNI